MNLSKINTDRIAWIILIIMMAMQLSLMKIFAGIIPVFNVSYNTPLLCTLYLLMIVAVMVLVLIPRIVSKNGISFAIFKEYKFLSIILGILLLSIISTDIVTIIRGQLRITNIFTHNLDYFYAFLALPIVILLCEKKITLEKFADVLLILTIMSMAMRFFVVIYHMGTGIEIECISKEYAIDDWLRSGRIRVMAPSLISICVLMATYLFFETKAIAKKIFYALSVLLVFAFSAFVWQSRAGIIVMAGGVAAIILFKNKSKKLWYICWGLLALAIIAFIALGGIGKFMAMFSTDDTSLYAGENRGHLYAYQLFFGRYLQAPIFGEGLTEKLAQLFPNGRYMWMCDAGFLYSLLPMGILIGVFFIGLMIRGFYLYFVNRKENYGSLILGITLFYIVNEFVSDMFFTPLAFVVPFIICIPEYLGQLKKEKG